MNELTRYEPADTAPVAVSDLPPAVSALAEWAQSASAAYELATRLCTTSFVPEAFRNKPEEGAAAILAGAEVGLSPMASLKSYDVIQGTAAPRAIALRAIVQSQGHDMWLEESTETRAVMKGRRKGSQKVQESVWTIDRAKKLGLVGKHNWKNQPGAMLVARATSECARLVASDAILGIGYAIEEMDDYDADPTTNGTGPAKKATARRTARRASNEPKEPEPAPEPDLDEPAETNTEPDGPEPITEDQMKKIHAAFGELGITDRDEKLVYAIRVIDRDIESSTELNIREASALIDQLETDIRDRNRNDTEPEFDPTEGDGWVT